MVGVVLCDLALAYFKYCSHLFTVILEMDCPFFGGRASKEIEARHQVENLTSFKLLGQHLPNNAQLAQGIPRAQSMPDRNLLPLSWNCGVKGNSS